MTCHRLILALVGLFWNQVGPVFPDWDVI
jgi:hypothetical protein